MGSGERACVRPRRRPLLVTADRVIVAPDEPLIHDGGVLVGADGDIEAVGPRELLTRRAGRDAEHRAFPGSTVLPGLIDCHVHLAFDAGPDPAAALMAADDVSLAAAMAGRAHELLESGVTSARDLGDRGGHALRLRESARSSPRPAPRLVVAGSPLTPPQGHCWFLGGEVEGVAGIHRRVAELAAAGADVVKVMASGGRMTVGGASMWEPQFSGEELRAVVVAAREHGLPVAAHAHGTDSIEACVVAGVDTLEHCSWLVGEPRAGRYEVREPVAAAIAEAGILVCPARSRNWPAFPHLDDVLGRLSWMADHGIKMVAGTDAGVAGSVIDDLVGALGLYVAAGFPRSEVLTMATTRAAAALGLGSVTGRLVGGMRADLIVVDGDPLAGLDALRRLRLVVADGRVHVPAIGRDTRRATGSAG